MYRRHRCCCNNDMNLYKEEVLEKKCNEVSNVFVNTEDCACGFDEEYGLFPESPMFGQSYVPIQIMDQTFTPSVGLKMGTIFPELVSPYYPNQSIEEIEYIEAANRIGKGCNR